MVRSMVALLAGYAVMVVIVMAGVAAWFAARLPGGLAALREGMKTGKAPAVTRGYLAFNLSLSFAAAVAGGLATVAIAASKSVRHLEVLGALVVAMGLLSAGAPSSAGQPKWYKLLIPLVGAAGVATAALVTGGAG